MTFKVFKKLYYLIVFLTICSCNNQPTNTDNGKGQAIDTIVPEEKPISEMTMEEIEQTPRFKAKMRELAPVYAKYKVEFKMLCGKWRRCSTNREKIQFIHENEYYVGELFDVDISTVSKAENLFVTHPNEFLYAMELKLKARACRELAEENYSKAMELRYSE